MFPYEGARDLREVFRPAQVMGEGAATAEVAACYYRLGCRKQVSEGGIFFCCGDALRLSARSRTTPPWPTAAIANRQPLTILWERIHRTPFRGDLASCAASSMNWVFQINASTRQSASSQAW